MSLKEWIEICPDGIVTVEVLLKAKKLLFRQRAEPSIKSSPTPISPPSDKLDETIPGDPASGEPVEP